jgi:hypothetical protein
LLLLSSCTTIARRAGTTHTMPHPAHAYHAAVLRVRPITTARWGEGVARVGAGWRAEWLGWAFLLFLAVLGLGAECGVRAVLLLCGIVLGLRDRFPGGTWPVRGVDWGPGEGVWWWWVEGLRVMVSRLLCVVCVYGLFTSMICGMCPACLAADCRA